MSTERPDHVFDPPFEIVEPAAYRAPLVFDSPHSGSVYPAQFLAQSRLERAELERAEDSFVDDLIADLPARGFATMRAHFPRTYVDVNREPFELDPRMFEGRLPSFINSRSMRVAGGLGTIPRVACDAQDIYRSRLPADEALARIEYLYKPYHRALRRLIASVQKRFGVAVLIDCHSMPSIGHAQEAERRPDLVIGDRYGTSCAPELTGMIEDFFTARHYAVKRNKPYAGGFITEHYGTPLSGIHALQLEFNRALYMDEQTHMRAPSLPRVAQDVRDLADALAIFMTAMPAPYQNAAE